MRDIMFHGKRKDNGEWVEGFYCKTYTFKAPHTHDGIMYKVEQGSQYPYFEYMSAIIDPSTIGQYIGFPDKNGKLIFEGHIVQFRTKNSTFKPLYVRWNNETAQFVASTKDGTRYYPMDSSWEYEILGNIYDNAELLED